MENGDNVTPWKIEITTASIEKKCTKLVLGMKKQKMPSCQNIMKNVISNDKEG